jgi:signal transduction histidine kinase
VWTDRVAVAAVLDNLLSNAVKYSPRGKDIRVRVEGEPASAVCSVADDGPGLSPEDQARLFEPGVRLASVPSGGEPSTGYGLAVTKRLIDRLGGEIWCVSRLGRGTTFSFRLPAHGQGLHEASPGLPGSVGGPDQDR